jgi:hypothetical protein
MENTLNCLSPNEILTISGGDEANDTGIKYKENINLNGLSNNYLVVGALCGVFILVNFYKVYSCFNKAIH